MAQRLKAGTPLKFQINFILNKMEMLLSQPLAKLSFVFRANNQRIESVERPKAMKEIPLNETLNLITIIYEDLNQICEETIAHCDVFLNQSKNSKIIGVFDLDLGAFATKAQRNQFEERIFLDLEKSPEYKCKLEMTISMKFLEIEKDINNLPKKMRGKSNTPTKYEIKSEKPQEKEEIDELGRERKGQNRIKRSATPTPSISKNIVHVNEEEFKKSLKDILLEKNEEINFNKTPEKKEIEKKQVFSTISHISEKDDFKKGDFPRRQTFGNKNIEEDVEKILQIEDSGIKEQDTLDLKTNLEFESERKNFELKLKELQNEKNEISNKLSLEINKNEEFILVEERLKKEIESKDKEVNEIREKINELFNLNIEKERELKNIESINNDLKEELLKINNEISWKDNCSNNQVKAIDAEAEFYREKIKQLEEELMNKKEDFEQKSNKKQQELENLILLNNSLDKKNQLLQEEINKEKLKIEKEKESLNENMKSIEEHRDNLVKQLNHKESKITELQDGLSDLQLKYVQSKETIADMINLVFEKGGEQLMESIEEFISNIDKNKSKESFSNTNI